MNIEGMRFSVLNKNVKASVNGNVDTEKAFDELMLNLCGNCERISFDNSGIFFRRKLPPCMYREYLLKYERVRNDERSDASAIDLELTCDYLIIK